MKSSFSESGSVLCGEHIGDLCLYIIAMILFFKALFMIDLGDLRALTGAGLPGVPTTLLLGLSNLAPICSSCLTVGGVSGEQSAYGISLTSFLRSNGFLLKVGDKSTGRQFSRFKVIFSGFFISISS